MDRKQILDQAFKAHRSGDVDQAADLYRRIIDSGFQHESVLNNMSAILADKEEYDEALALIFSSPLHLDSSILQATLGAIYKFKGDLEKAVIHSRLSLDIDPDQPDTWNNLGSSLRSLGHWVDGTLALQEAVSRRPKFSLALYNLGNAYLERRDLKNAIQYYDRSLEADPDYASAHVNRGNCYRELRNFAEAEKSYKKAFELDSNLTETQFNLGVIYMEQSRFTDAIGAFSKTLTTELYGIQSVPHLIGATQKICDWTHVDRLKEIAKEAISSNTFKQCPPFNLISISDDPELLLSANLLYTQTHVKPKSITKPQNKNANPKKKLAYFSCDIHDHATGYLIAELFELHDDERFDITLISYGPDSRGSSIRHRIKSSKVNFVDASLWSDPQIIEYIEEMNTDILVDLKGYTAGCRPQVLAARPAPIQIQYLGYPATMGAAFIDYFLADPITVPPDLEKYFSEKILRLPVCYQINDSKREISQKGLTRADVGLPNDVTVFASFNSNYKITKEMWGIWMSILSAASGSVLWLLEDNSWSKINLIEHASNHGISDDRIIFAEKMPQSEHLERIGLADLALDTFPCCGHTTTSDALYAGLPVLTLIGSCFHSRVSASLIAAQGLDDLLVTHSISEYAATAVTLSSSPTSLEELKRRVRDAKKTGALFKTPAWVLAYENLLDSIERPI